MQIDYLQQRTLVPSPAALVDAVFEAADGGAGTLGLPLPLLVLDAYHGFCALPTDLSAAFAPPEVPGDSDSPGGQQQQQQQQQQHPFCYVAGLLKHAGCGPNAAFCVAPPALVPALRPLLTGWLANPAALGPGGAGARLGAEVR